ncbi:hypothetical protein, partial [Leucobacter sp. M11]|uniref:hypothetical protein n=1 Tax=Leucobacter sp. M11 TaxID=2993565 RepID=UPI002D8062DA
PIDVYRLLDADLGGVRGIHLAGDSDQLFLAAIQPRLDAFVRGGGRILVNGHVQRPFLTGLSPWRKLAFSSPRDLALTRHSEHPVWRGTDPEAFLYSTGEPGRVPLERLREIGVAGFYGRGYVSRLPAGATVVHTLGEVAAPIDVEYPLGEGRVLVHCGNDLGMFISEERGTEHMRAQLASWLGGAE